MKCQYCGSINGEDDHRCLRCGRRIAGVVVAAPHSYIGATALAVAAAPARERAPEANRAASPEQAPLFFPVEQQAEPQTAQDSTSAPTQKIIPWEDVQRRFAGKVPAPQVMTPPAAPVDVPVRKAAQPRVSKKTPPAGQGNLDFRPNVAHERVLPTGVPAHVYGDSRVAPPMRRLTAGAMDVAMVLIGFGVFAISAKLAALYLAADAAIFGAGKTLWMTLAGALFLVSLFYGLVWAFARRETAGMNWTQLHLVTFDGSALDGRNRTIRFVSAWLSYCSGGLGLLWALADEENLAFHDHISKTYPAELDGGRVLVRR
jgi:hypothetical protein